jgi:hypothetical protein
MKRKDMPICSPCALDGCEILVSPRYMSGIPYCDAHSTVDKRARARLRFERRSKDGAFWDADDDHKFWTSAEISA